MADPLTICLALGGLILDLGSPTIELRWTHSVQRSQWSEPWQATPDGLVAQEATIQGSGAGMDPPDGARRTATGWSWRPDLPPLPSLDLARSDATADWTICRAGRCATVTELAGRPADGEPARLSPCPAQTTDG